MIKSMTGFGRGEASGSGVRYEVELRGVNHRFLEMRFRLPQEIGHLEADLRSRVGRTARRGRLDISVSRSQSQDPETSVNINREVVARYLEAASALSREFQVPGALGLESILALPGAVRFETRKEGVEGEKEIVMAALDQALTTFEEARTAEGARLGQDLADRIRAVESDLNGIEETALAMPAEYAARIRKRMAEILEGVPLDEARLVQEAAYLAGRSDVTEEIVRLRAHLQQARDHLGSRDQPVGKSLDFLVQEMHREANTIGSKSEDLRLAQTVLRIKAEVERFREQIQNIE